MKTFIDLQGVSGRVYRFRIWREGDLHQPIGGNYAVVRVDGGGLQVLGLGATNDLSGARRTLSRLKRLGGEAVYTRHNVSRGVRESELQDLVARYEPNFIGDDG